PRKWRYEEAGGRTGGHPAPLLLERWRVSGSGALVNSAGRLEAAAGKGGAGISRRPLAIASPPVSRSDRRRVLSPVPPTLPCRAARQSSRANRSVVAQRLPP